jgi:fructokinase
VIVSCGEALIDFVPVATERGPGYLPLPGGSPFNVAVAMARLGAPAGYLGKLSTDFFGALLARTLLENGVDDGLVLRGHEPTPLAFVGLDEEEPQFAIFGTGACDRSIGRDELPDELPESVEALHFGSYALAVEPAATTWATLMAREAGKRVIALDPNIRPALVPDRKDHVAALERMLGWVDVVKLSRADLAWIAPGEDAIAVARRWQARGPQLVVVTLGAHGAVGLLPDGTPVRRPGRATTVVDTVGAGDSFQAALLAWLHHEGRLGREAIAHLGETRLAACLDFAIAAAAITCARPGADSPRRHEVTG